jgi:hypothetical protein
MEEPFKSGVPQEYKPPKPGMPGSGIYGEETRGGFLLLGNAPWVQILKRCGHARMHA